MQKSQQILFHKLPSFQEENELEKICTIYCVHSFIFTDNSFSFKGHDFLYTKNIYRIFINFIYLLEIKYVLQMSCTK